MMVHFVAAVAVLFLQLGTNRVAANECQDEYETCFRTCETLRKYGGIGNWWSCYPECANQKDACEESAGGILGTDSCEAQRAECNVPCYNMLKYCPEHCPFSACFNGCAGRECENDPTPQDNPDPPVRDCQETWQRCFYVCEQQRKFCSGCDVWGCYVGCADDKQLCEKEQELTDVLLGTSCNDTLVSCADACNSTNVEERGQCLVTCGDERATCDGEDPVDPIDLGGVQDCQEHLQSCQNTCGAQLRYCYTCDIGACYIGCSKDKIQCDYNNLAQEDVVDSCQASRVLCDANCDACADCDAAVVDDCSSGCETQSDSCFQVAGNDSSGFRLVAVSFAGLIISALGIAF